MAIDGQTPGNGSKSPFGNGDGATSAEGASTGAHNFLTDPASGAPKTGGRDFTKESREQKEGLAPDLSKESIPTGGPTPFAQTDAVARKDPQNAGVAGEVDHKPFKL